MRYLLLWLVVPFSIFTILVIVASLFTYDPWSSLLVNLAAVFIGSIITVLYIDKVLWRHERAEWAHVSTRIERLVERIAAVGITTIRTSVGVNASTIDFGPSIPFHSKQFRRMMADVAEQRIRTELGALRSLDVKGWNTLAHNMQVLSASVNQLIGLFGSRMDAATMESILVLQEIAEGMVASYSTFPDIYGVAKAELQPRLDGSSSVPLQEGLYDFAEDEASRLLLKCAALLRSLDGG